MNHVSTHVATYGPVIFIILVMLAIAFILAIIRHLRHRRM